jgi:hypothetical protein
MTRPPRPTWAVALTVLAAVVAVGSADEAGNGNHNKGNGHAEANNRTNAFGTSNFNVEQTLNDSPLNSAHFQFVCAAQE